MTGPELPPPRGAEEADGWRHLHPLSPLLRGGIAFAAVVAYVVSQQLDTLFGAEREDPTGGHLGWAALVVLGVLLLIVSGAWLSWRFSRFRVSENLIELRTGFVFRQHRQVRFDRIQAVDIARPLLARLVGLSEVVVQSAGGHDANLRLSFLTDASAQQVREQLMDLARHSDEAAPGAHPQDAGVGGERTDPGAGTATDGAPAAAPEATRVLAVPNARIVQSILFSGPAFSLVVAVPAVLVALALGAGGGVAALGPVVLGVGSALLKRLTHEANFVLHHQGDRLRITHGLTDLRTTTVPLHRVQAIEVGQPALWRVTGWWRLRVNVAGAGGGSDDATETLLLPVGTLEESLRVLTLVRPGLPPAAALAAMVGRGPDEGFVTASERAAALDPVSWRRLGYAALPDAALTRRGVLRRSAQVVPHARIQSLKATQGPLQRRRGLASVSLVSTPGPVSPGVAHLDVAQAERLLNEQVARSSRARRRAGTGGS